jgi:hypothetical protein
MSVQRVDHYVHNQPGYTQRMNFSSQILDSLKEQHGMDIDEEMKRWLEITKLDRSDDVTVIEVYIDNKFYKRYE